jgi:HSP20 family protein
MNQLLEESMVRSPSGLEEREDLIPVRVDMVETDEGIVVKSDLPGVKPEDVDISIRENTLTIKGEFEAEEETEQENVHIRERRYGAFQRSIPLPKAVEAEKAEAEFEDGVLRVTLPTVEEEKPKRISVQAK